MYGRGPLGARRFCKECTERCNRPISYENALLSFGSRPLYREKVCALGELRKKSFSKSLGGGGGGEAGTFGGGGELAPPPPPPRPPYWIEPCLRILTDRLTHIDGLSITWVPFHNYGKFMVDKQTILKLINIHA